MIPLKPGGLSSRRGDKVSELGGYKRGHQVVLEVVILYGKHRD